MISFSFIVYFTISVIFYLSTSLRLTLTLTRLCVFGFIQKEKSYKKATTNSSVSVYHLNESIHKYLLTSYYVH